MIETLVEIIELGLWGILISVGISTVMWVVTGFPKSKDKKI
tara:strand:- start:745 stop:867 length:123 start_codon:yes stop_codon:yes gene_type:complete